MHIYILGHICSFVEVNVIGRYDKLVTFELVVNISTSLFLRR